MQVSVEKGEGLERRLRISVPRESINKQVNTRLHELSKKAKLRGFRPGKVPLAVIERHYGKAVRDEVMEGVMRETFVDAMQQENLKPAGMPTLEPVEGHEEEGHEKKDADFEYTAKFEVYPEVKLKGLEKIAVVKQVSEVTDKDVEDLIQKMRKQQAEWKDVDHPAQAEDRITMDFCGTIKGVEFPGGKADNHVYELGSKGLLPEFETHLAGAKAGDHLKFKLKFPKDYHDKETAGKKAEFTVDIKKVEEPEHPPLDDAFAKKMGVAEGGIEAFRIEVRKTMGQNLNQALEANLKKDVFDKLLASNPIDIPKALVEQETERLLRATLQRITGKAEVDESLLEKLPRDTYHDEAKHRVSIGLLLAEAIRESRLEADTKRVREKVKELAQTYDDPTEVINWYYGNKERLSPIEAAVLEEQVLEGILEKAKITEKKVTYDEVMNPSTTKE